MGTTKTQKYGSIVIGMPVFLANILDAVWKAESLENL